MEVMNRPEAEKIGFVFESRKTRVGTDFKPQIPIT